MMMRSFYLFTNGAAAHKVHQALIYARFGVGPPQISSRASAYLEVGGAPLLQSGEDFALTFVLRLTDYFFGSLFLASISGSGLAEVTAR